MKPTQNKFRLLSILICALAVAGFALTTSHRVVRAGSPADQPAAQTASCSQFMAPKRNVSGKMIGQEDCLMQDHGIVDPDGKYHRVEIGVSGTLSGWIVKEGARVNHFTSAPDFVFTQMGNNRPRFHGILKYDAARGTSITLLYPESGWNGKFFIMVHGVGGSFRKGSLKAWDYTGTRAATALPSYDASKPWADVSKYEKAMLDKGYAVARSRRNADRETPGDFEATLDNGEVWPDLNINQNPELILDEARLVRNLLKDRLGRQTTRIYWYGHSAGAHMGLLVNYMSQVNPELNKDPDGRNTVDGFIDDDPGGGLYVPILMKNGQDILFRSPDTKTKFVKSIIVAHQLYPNEYSEDTPWEMELKTIPKFISPNYLANKRTTARVMKEKSMEGGFRMYEVKGVSHNGGDTLKDLKDRTYADRDIDILELSRLMDGVVDLLDNWVEKGIQPPATKSEAAGIGSTPEAVNLPETACPLGVYFPYPPLHSIGGVGETSLALFDGQGLEPLDGRLENVDMNGDGQRDQRETMTQAWRRLGLLKGDEAFSREKYVACVQQATAKLRKENFITQRVAGLYLQEAQTKEFPSQ